MPVPLCFMVMPFGIKDTGAQPPRPARIDFDTLWEKALLPALEGLGYQPVRADQDLGGMIIKDMLERLYFSDLVVADLTIANGNVYYEVSVRHAAKQAGCVLISAEWSKQLFDLGQIRQIRYPLPAGEISEAVAAEIRAALAASLPRLADGDTPVFQTLPGYPGNVVADRATVVRGFLDELASFQAEVRVVRSAPAAEQNTKALALREKFPAASMKLPNVAQELVYLLRDYVGWSEVLAYIDALPAALRKLPMLHEQRCLAQSETGDPLAAIAALKELVRASGDSSERQGLLGGRYKRLLRAATDPADQAKRRTLLRGARGGDRGCGPAFLCARPPQSGLDRGRGPDGARERPLAPPPDQHRELDAPERLLQPTAGIAPGRPRTLHLSRVCARIKEDCQLHTGIMEGTGYRNQGWYVYQIGKQIERMDQTTRLLDINYHRLLPAVDEAGSPIDASQWNALLRSVAGYHAYRRVHPRGMQPAKVAEFLLFDLAFPRSVTLCVREIDELALAALVGQDERPWVVGRLSALREIARATIDDVMAAGLHEFLDQIQRHLIALTDELGDGLFGHRF